VSGALPSPAPTAAPLSRREPVTPAGADSGTDLGPDAGTTVCQPFTGSVAGIGSGTLTWQTQFQATFDCGTLSLSNLNGTRTLISRTGALGGLHGTLTFTGDTYTGILAQ
jgi:hypothetical protein